MAKLDNDGTPINFGLTEKQKAFAEKYRALKFVWGEKAVGIGVQAARAAGYEGNEQAIKVEASRLKKNERVRAYLEFLEEASGALSNYPILSDDEMKRLASKEAQTAKSDASRVRALEVLAKLKEGDSNREREMSDDDLISGIAGDDEYLREKLSEHLGLDPEALRPVSNTAD